MTKVINNLLPWDGSHLGSHIDIKIISHWTFENNNYVTISLPDGWLNNRSGGIIYCSATCTKNLFPCIVEDIKKIFNIPRRGIHRIVINNKEYLLYYVPISLNEEVIWETPLNRLDSKHILRTDPNFRKSIQKIIAFCDILALSNTGEHTIRIRPGVNNYVPININENTTNIIKENIYDCSIISKTLFSKWFGENTCIHQIVKEMIYLKCSQTNDHKIPTINNNELRINDISVITTNTRNKIDEIIKNYDVNYIWYSNFIIDRLSRHLLIP